MLRFIAQKSNEYNIFNVVYGRIPVISFLDICM